MIPLAAVGAHLNGQVVNVSSAGVKIRVAQQMAVKPRIGDVYRIVSSQDRMLCEVTHWIPSPDGLEIGFKIVYWGDQGALKRLTEASPRKPGIWRNFVASRQH